MRRLQLALSILAPLLIAGSAVAANPPYANPNPSLALTGGTVSGAVQFDSTLTLSHGLVLSQPSNNVLRLFENAEDLTLTVSANLWTLDSGTSATFKITPSLTLSGTVWVGAHATWDPTIGGIAVAPYATPVVYPDIAFAAFDSHFLLQGGGSEGPQISFIQDYNYGPGRVAPQWRLGRVFL